MAILSLQSQVTFGHVGNAAAVFCLRRSGHDVWPIDTVSFSNHPGYGTVRGRVTPASEVVEIVGGLADLGILPDCEAVLTGYLGSAATGSAALDAVSRVKAANADALYCCDPVMGDHDKGRYVADDLCAFFRSRAAHCADILVPNHFELELLGGCSLPTGADVLGFCRALVTERRRTVVVTSIDVAEHRSDRIGNLVVTTDGAWQVTTPRLDLVARGAGDALAALFLGHHLTSGDPAAALSAAVSSVFAIIDATVAAGASELCLVSAQNAIVDPPHRFPCQRLG